MKRVLSFLLALLCVFSLVACGESEEELAAKREAKKKAESEAAVAAVKEQIDDIGTDLSQVKHMGWIFRVRDAESAYEELEADEKAQVDNYAMLENAIKAIEIHDKKAALERAVLKQADFDIKYQLKSPASYQRDNYFYFAHEYSGKCYVRLTVYFYAENSFGATLRDSMDVYYIYKGTLEGIDPDKAVKIESCSDDAYFEHSQDGESIT